MIFPNPVESRFWFFAAGFILSTGIARAVEPVMDNSLFDNSRASALYMLKTQGNPQAAERMEEKALQIAQDQFGPTHPSLVPILNDLATVQRGLGEYEKSEENYKWGLALLERNFGPDDISVADSLDHLTALDTDLGHNEEALLLEKKAVTIRENQKKPDLLALAQSLYLLGRVQIHLGANAQAQVLFQQALDTLEKNQPIDADLAIDCLKALAQTYGSDSKTQEEQSALEKALALAQKIFPSSGVEVSDAMESLADFFRAQGEAAKAQSLYESAFQIAKPTVGTVDSLPALPYVKRLAQLEGDLNQWKESENLWQKAVQTEKTTLGPRHPRVALDLIHLAQAETSLKQKSLAKKNLKESLTILKIYFPPDHPWIELAQKRLSSLEKD